MTKIAPGGAESARTAVEPRRLQILEIIWDRELSVNEIASHLPVSVAAVSQHLAKLRAAGLVSVRAEGRRRIYRATKAAMGALAVVLESSWADRAGEPRAVPRPVEAAKPEETP